MKECVWILFLSSLLGSWSMAQAKKPSLPPAMTAAPSPALPAVNLEELKNQQAVLETALGKIVLRFFPDKAPEHVKYIVSLLKSGFYDGTAFHGMMLGGFIQGGDPLTKDPSTRMMYGTGGFHNLTPEFSDAKLVRGAVAAVLPPEDKNKAGSQFFICVVDQPQLDGKYTVWGQVAEGMEVVEKISSTPVDSRSLAKERVEVFKAYLQPIPPPEPIPFVDATKDEMKKYHVVLETTMGLIEVELFPEVAPEHVRNFLRLSKADMFDNTVWHRVVPGFVIQGGDVGTRTPPATAQQMSQFVKHLMVEIGEMKHQKGILSMARGDELDSATTSFFICLADLPSLDGKYTVFGKVVKGMETVEKIASVPVDGERPLTRVDLLHAEVVEAGK